MEFLEAAGLLLDLLDMGDRLLELRAQRDEPLHERLHGLDMPGFLVTLDLFEIGALGHVVDRRHDLQLRRALVDIHDTGVAVEPFAGIILHETRTAVNLDRVVGHLIGVLGREEFQQRREAVGQFVVVFHLLALLRFERTLVRDMSVLLVDLHETGRLVEQRTHALRLGLHVRQHLRNRGEADNVLAELRTLVGVFQRFAVGRFAQPHRLRADTQTGGVHQRHHIFDEAHLTVADQLCRSVGEDQLARGRALDSELVLDAAHLHAAVALVVDEHRQAAGVGRTLLGTSQHQRYVAVAVGDETLHAVQEPCALLLRPRGLQHHGSQIRTGVRLREVHRTGRTGRNPRQVLLFKLLRGELVERLGAVLQAPDILEAGIGARHHLVGHHEAEQREIQAVVLARQRQTAQAGLDDRVQVTLRALGVDHMVVHHLRPLVIHALGIGSDHVAAHLARDRQHLAVGVHGVFEILRRIIIGVLLGESALFQFHDLTHQRMLEVVLQILVI